MDQKSSQNIIINSCFEYVLGRLVKLGKLHLFSQTGHMAVTGGMCLAGRAIHASFYVEMATRVFKKILKMSPTRVFMCKWPPGDQKYDKSVSHASFYV